MANIRAHGSGWQVQIRKKHFPPQTRTFDKKADAEEWAAKVETEMNSAKWQDGKKARATPFIDILQKYHDEECPKRRGGENQKYKFLAFMENPLFQKPVSAITPEDIVAYRNEREKAGCVSSTIRTELSLLSMVFKTAKREWGYSSLGNPAGVDSVTRPALKPEETRDRVATPKETEEILGRTTSSFLKPFVRLLAETAARRGELCLLKWERVDLVSAQPTMTLTADTTKTAKKRIVPLSPKAVEILRGLPEPHEGPVFKQASWEGGDPRKAPALRADSVTQAWIRARTRAAEENPSLADLRIHDQRHTAATAIFKTGNLKELEVAAITGHDDLRSLKRYTHPDAEHLGGKLGWTEGAEKPQEASGKASVSKEGDLFVVVIDGIEAKAPSIKEAREMIDEMKAIGL